MCMCGYVCVCVHVWASVWVRVCRWVGVGSCGCDCVWVCLWCMYASVCVYVRGFARVCACVIAGMRVRVC